jgi:hypothetical protein
MQELVSQQLNLLEILLDQPVSTPLLSSQHRLLLQKVMYVTRPA